jgi:hypothetical protein
MAGSHHLLGVSVLCVFALESAHAFVPKPLLLSATRPSDLRISTRILNPYLTTRMASVSRLNLRTNSDRGIGPHIRVGKKGAILNFWGFWVMFYSVFIALFGYAYLKLRILLGVLTLGLLKPKAEHCCWIMHAWCKLVLWLGLSNPEVRCPLPHNSPPPLSCPVPGPRSRKPSTEGGNHPRCCQSYVLVRCAGALRLPGRPQTLVVCERCTPYFQSRRLVEPSLCITP